MKKFNIYYRSDGRWEGRISRGKRKNGTRRFHYFFGKTRDEVQEKMMRYRSLEQYNSCVKNVSELFQEWFQSIQHRVKESTAANYRMKWNKHISPIFGEKSVSNLTDTDFYEYIAAKQQDGLSNRYISDIIILMKSVFKFAVHTYHIQNPLDNVNLPKKKSPEIDILDDKEQQKLQQYISEHPSRTTLGIALAMVTGIRIGELCALQWQDIDFEKRILTVRKTVQRIQNSGTARKTKLIITEPKSETSKRKIPIPECIMEFLKRYKGNDSEYICSGKERVTEPRTMQYRFAKILKNVKLPSVHFHSLRHMFASRCVKLGFDIKALSEILGHSNVRITLEKYVHSDFSQKQEYMKRIQVVI